METSLSDLREREGASQSYVESVVSLGGTFLRLLSSCLLTSLGPRAAYESPCRASQPPELRRGEELLCDPREAACEENVHWCHSVKEGL